MILGSSDAINVIANGWGERHGCAGGALGLPPTYTLSCASRDVADLAIIGRLLDVATCYIAGTTPQKIRRSGQEACGG